MLSFETGLSAILDRSSIVRMNGSMRVGTSTPNWRGSSAARWHFDAGRLAQKHHFPGCAHPQASRPSTAVHEQLPGGRMTMRVLFLLDLASISASILLATSDAQAAFWRGVSAPANIDDHRSSARSRNFDVAGMSSCAGISVSIILLDYLRKSEAPAAVRSMKGCLVTKMLRLI